MKNTIFQQYAELDAQIKALQDKQSELRKAMVPAVEEMIAGTDKKSFDTDFGKFTKRETEVWEYSESLQKFEKETKSQIKQLNDEISKKKIWARGHGKAKKVDTISTVVFSPRKDK